MKYLRNVPLKKHTSFKIGGLAEFFCVPKSVDEIKKALDFAERNKLRVAVIGAGTNLLIRDEEFEGLVIKLARGLNWIKIENNRVLVGAGVPLLRLIKVLSQKGFGGLEFLTGIPGSVGGAVVMNAGAWGKEIGKRVEQVRVLDEERKERILNKRNLGFVYRKSRIQSTGWIVTEVTFRLQKKNKKAIKNKIEEYLIKRKISQPLGTPNSGSVFKNPIGDFAGRIIEAAGCKGLRVGDAQVSRKHANFIVNLGEAKANDVIKLMTRVQKAVKDKFKIMLEPEIKIMVKSPS
jgi:UDP-N-acetylmuramate dehydrogenase